MEWNVSMSKFQSSSQPFWGRTVPVSPWTFYPSQREKMWSTGATGPSGPSGCDDRDFWDAVDPMTLSDVELASDACNLEISGDPAFFLTKFIGKKKVRLYASCTIPQSSP